MFESWSLHQVCQELSSVVANVEGVLGGAEIVLPGCEGPPLDEDHIEVSSAVEILKRDFYFFETSLFDKNHAHLFTIFHFLGGVVAILRESVHNDDGPPAGVKVPEAAGIVWQDIGLICQSNILNLPSSSKVLFLGCVNMSINQPKMSAHVITQPV